jgi:hypothetical protein
MQATQFTNKEGPATTALDTWGWFQVCLLAIFDAPGIHIGQALGVRWPEGLGTCFFLGYFDLLDRTGNGSESVASGENGRAEVFCVFTGNTFGR